MAQIEQTVSNLIPGQFPAFYNEQGPNFIAFMQAYYQWLEQSYPTQDLTIVNLASSTNFANGETVYQTTTGINVATGTVISVNGPTVSVNNFSGTFTSNLALYGATSNAVANLAAISNSYVTGNPIYQSRNLMNYADVDNTLEEFLVYFTNTYLQGIQYNSLVDRRLTIKRILDLYRAKGNIRGLKLLFQLVFAEDIDVYLPGKDVLKLSDGVWTIPQYLEVSNSPRINAFVGKTINGVSSGATAFVDRIVVRKVGSKFVYMFMLTNASEKQFETGEYLDVDGNLTGVPQVLGSLSDLVISEGSYGFNIGDIVSLSSNYGIEGTGRVTAIEDVSGIVQFNLIDGGWGFSNTQMSTASSNVLISNTVLYLADIQTTLPSNTRPFEKFSNLMIYSTTNTAVANIYVNAFGWGTTANVFAYANNGTFLSGETIVSTDGITGTVVSQSSNAFTLLTLSSPSGTFRINETVYQANSSANIAVGSVIYSNTSSAIVAASNGAFINTTSGNNYQVVGVTSAAHSNIAVTPSLVVTAMAVSNVVESYFKSNTTLTGQTSGATANVLYFNSELGITALNNALITQYNAVQAIYPGVITYSANNGTFFGGEVIYQSNGSANIATGTVISTNATTISVVPLSGTFTATTGSNTGVQLAISNTVIVANIGAFRTGEIIVQSNGTANVATGYLISANSSRLVINPTSGVFVPSNLNTFGLTGLGSLSTATITGPNNAIQITGNLWHGSEVINAISSNTGLIVGQRVSSATAGFDANSVITAINSSAITISVPFTGTSTTGATVNATSIAISNASYANAVVTSYVPVNSANAILSGFSTGNYANIAIGVVNSSETIFFYTDMVGGNNVFGQPYLLVPLNQYAFGFPKFPSANLTAGYLKDILAFELLNVGEIESIRVTNPGTRYSHAPYVDIWSPAVGPKKKNDYIININNLSGNFIIDEEVSQNVALTNVTGVELGANVVFTPGQIVYQVASNPAGTYLANVNTTQIVANTGTPSFTSTFSAGQYLLIGNTDIRLVTSVSSGAITIASAPSVANGVANVLILQTFGGITTVPSANLINVINTGSSAFLTGQNVFSQSTGTNANVTLFAATAYGTALGKVLAANSSVMSIRRWSINQDFSNTGGNIVGILSGANAVVSSVAPNTQTNYAGDNANIVSSVITSNGSVLSMAVQSSGIGYINSESVTFTSQDGSRSGVAVTILGKQGYGAGYYDSTKGFLDDDKYITDGTYYQNYAYEIQSSLPTSEYENMVIDTVHAAGTKLYGKVIKKSTLNASVGISNIGLGPNTTPIIG